MFSSSENSLEKVVASTGRHVAIKVQRRKYVADALNEISIHQSIPRDHPASRYIVRSIEALFHDGHVCQVHELHGRETGSFADPMPIGDVKSLVRQVLEALALLHSHDLVHTDLKPRNLLWCEQTKEVRLIDLGNAEKRLAIGQAIATREYCPPEMLVGNPMGPPVDLWSLACTTYELLTGEQLFNPWAVCRQKYTEFNPEGDDEESPADEDDLDEEREQLTPGGWLGAKYRLIEVLGRGKFGTVWKAEMLHSAPVDSVLPSPEEALQLARAARRPAPVKVGLDIYEVVLNYEHFVQMQERVGPFPEHLARQGKYQHILYGPDGTLRFDPQIMRRPIRETLASAHHFAPESAAAIEAFLLPLLQLNPEERVTASEALQSPWLSTSD